MNKTKHSFPIGKSFLTAITILISIAITISIINPIGIVSASWSTSSLNELKFHSVQISDNIGTTLNFDSINDTQTISTGTHIRTITITVWMNFSNGLIYGLVEPPNPNFTIIQQSIGQWCGVSAMLSTPQSDLTVLGMANFISYSGNGGEWGQGYATFKFSNLNYIINVPGNYHLYLSLDIHRMR